MKYRECFIALLCIASLGACRAVEPLRIPPVSNIVSIDVYTGAIEESNRIRGFAEPGEIEEIVLFLESHNENWYSSYTTFPTPQITAIFRNREHGVEAVLWFGPNWVGGQSFTEKSEEAKLWGLNSEKLAELRSLLKIDT